MIAPRMKASCAVQRSVNTASLVWRAKEHPPPPSLEGDIRFPLSRRATHLKVRPPHVHHNPIPLAHVRLLVKLGPELFRRDGVESLVRERGARGGEGGVPGLFGGLLLVCHCVRESKRSKREGRGRRGARRKKWGIGNGSDGAVKE